jgi:MFS transporter, DHA1 family, inner membrane transport protein
MRERFVLGALALSVFAFITTETLPIGLLPLIARDLHTTTGAVGLLVTAYGLVVVIFSIPLARLTVRVPRRYVLSALMVVFVLANALSAVAGGYRTLLVARIVIALSQALFWSVVTPTAAGLFRPEVRGRVLSVLFAGTSIGSLAGVPAGTWLGQQTNWRVSFLALTVLGLAVLVVIVVLLPTTPAGVGDADHGSTPDAGRYWSVVVSTALAVGGGFTAFTYINPFLTQVTGYAESSISLLLVIRGAAGLAGVVVAGWLADRDSWRAMVLMIGGEAVALFAQYGLGTSKIGAMVAIAAAGFCLSAMSTALGVRVLQVAPGSSDVAAAGSSSAFNVGITAGAFVGSVVLSHGGLAVVPLVGAFVSVAAFAAILAEPRFSSNRAIRTNAEAGNVRAK